MSHRSYGGMVRYDHDRIGERGRERFSVTVQPGGERTLRARSEIDRRVGRNDADEGEALLRDVVLTVDAAFRPLDAFIRLTAGGAFLGSGWFRFTETGAEAEVDSAELGRFSQRLPLPERARSFGCHPVTADAWHLAAHDPGGDRVQTLPHTPMSSPLPDGGSGPMLSLTDLRVERVGSERVTVPAGSFDTERYRFLLDDGPPEELWVVPGDWLMVQIRWDRLETTYRLCELEGDPRC